MYNSSYPHVSPPGVDSQRKDNLPFVSRVWLGFHKSFKSLTSRRAIAKVNALLLPNLDDKNNISCYQPHEYLHVCKIFNVKLLLLA